MMRLLVLVLHGRAWDWWGCQQQHACVMTCMAVVLLQWAQQVQGMEAAWQGRALQQQLLLLRLERWPALPLRPHLKPAHC
jgi:hypothetical protein